MKFRYYITDLLDGCVLGTDSEIIAKELAEMDARNRA